MSTAYPTRGRAAYALGVLALLGFVLTTDMTLTALLVEPMKRDMALTDVEVALVQGTAYGLALGVASLPMGRLIDRYSRRALIAIGVAGWTGALIAIGLAGDLATVLAARAVLGIVAALVVPAAFSIGADLYPAERRSVATSLLVVGQALGQGFGMFAGGKAYDALDVGGAGPFDLSAWRLIYLAAALLGASLLVLLAGMDEPVRQEHRARPSNLATAARELWSYRGFLLPLLFGLLFVQVTIQAASIWASPLLIRRGQTPGQFAGWMSAILLLGGAAGALAAGWLGETGRRRDGRAGVLLPGVLLSAAIAPASLFALAGSLALFGILFAFQVFAGAVVATIGVIAVTLVIPNEIRGLALGANTFAAAVFGAAGAPAAVALLSRHLGGEQHLGLAFVEVCVPSGIMGSLCLALALRSRAAPARDVGAGFPIVDEV